VSQAWVPPIWDDHSGIMAATSKLTRAKQGSKTALFYHRFIARDKLKPRSIKIVTFAAVMPGLDLMHANRG
jgi:hypothetical protein